MTSRGDLGELVRRAQESDREAFDLLFREHADQVEYFIRLRLGSRLRGVLEVEDVLQEVALRSWRSIGRFRWEGEGSFLRWLRSIAENMILEAASRDRRHPRLPAPANGAKDSPSQATLLRRAERFDRLQRAFDALSPDHRKIVLLARLEMLPLDVVAEKMGRSPAAVKQLLWRALKEMRAGFGETESLGLPDRPLLDGGSPDGKREPKR